MFSAEYNVAVGLVRGAYDLSALSDASLSDPDVVRFRNMAVVLGRTPRHKDIYYDPRDPDAVEVTLDDGSILRSECDVPLGDSANPLKQDDIRRKFDMCISEHRTPAECDLLWDTLASITTSTNLSELLSQLGSSERSNADSATLAN